MPRLLNRIRFRYTRFTHHFARSIRLCDSAFNALTVVGALACLVVLIVLIGFDLHGPDRALLVNIVRLCQSVFLLSLIFHLVFTLHKYLSTARVFKWISDGALLLTSFPLIYPRPTHPWFPWLAEILYSKRVIFCILAVYSIVELCYALMRLVSRRTNPSLLMSASFLFFIILGSLLLLLPKCTVTPITYIDSLFISTSAVCITGLTPVDVAATFTPVGVAILAVLVQIGGLGVLTFTSFFALYFSGGGSVYNQMLLRDLIYSKSMNALGPTLLYILGISLTIELLGAVGVYLTIPPQLGLDGSQKLIFAGFHSLSSFCNAGFSCIDGGMANQALMDRSQGLFIVTSLLIFAGAVGFPILVNIKDILANKIHKLWSRIHHRHFTTPVHLFDLNSKLVLSTTLTILVVASVAFFLLERHNTLNGMTLWQQCVQSMFNSLIPRSAGFATVNPADFLPLTLILVIAQMWVGGASQSLAGGIKVNTLATIFLNIRAELTGSARPAAWHRSISQSSVRRANTVFALAVISFLILFVIITALEPQLSSKQTIFEVTSALFTVGSSLGVTGQLCAASKVSLSVAMFLGRVGIISILGGILSASHDTSVYLPEENIIIN
ncbi:MAG: potassium transporter [Muribaculaceae bacterium]|nr:potassium transporter [Muribaculaceae bacterium]